MTFTDDDLKRLNKELPLIDTFGRWITTKEKMQALLARLEAAEKYGNAMAKDHPGWHLPKLWTWRKSCGKAGE